MAITWRMADDDRRAMLLDVPNVGRVRQRPDERLDRMELGKQDIHCEVNLGPGDFAAQEVFELVDRMRCRMELRGTGHGEGGTSIVGDGSTPPGYTRDTQKQETDK